MQVIFKSLLDKSDVAVMESPKLPKPLPPEPKLPSSKEAQPDLNVDELAEYEKVASAIGITTQGALTSERLLQCLKRENVRIFDGVQVCDFLKKKLGEWEWRGLRESDVEHLVGWSSHHGDYRIQFGKRQYTAQIPLPVLLTVQRVLEAVPEAHFYASAPKDTGDDPFLMVCTKDSGCFIIERWDEPDFRER